MSFPDWLWQSLLSGAGAGAAVAFGLFKFLGENWVKHQLAKDLEYAKPEISFHAAKRLKYQDQEYEVLPELWVRLSKAKAAMQVAVIEFRKMPDFSRMSGGDFEEWLSSKNLDEAEKEALRRSSDKPKKFGEILDYRRLNKAGECLDEFRDYLQKNRIFLSPEVREKLDQIQAALTTVWAHRTVDIQYIQPQRGLDLMEKALDCLNNEIQPLMEETESIIQRKLFPEAKG